MGNGLDLKEYMKGNVGRVDPHEILKAVKLNGGTAQHRHVATGRKKKEYYELNIQTKNLNIILSPHNVIGIERKKESSEKSGIVKAEINSNEWPILESIASSYKSRRAYIISDLLMITFLDGGLKYRGWKKSELADHMMI